MSLSQLNRMTAITLAREIAQHRVSPVEALDAALVRLGETELQLNAFVQVDAEGARAAARGAESDIMLGRPLGPLHGVPVSIKDLIDVEGLRATYGAAVICPQGDAGDDPAAPGRYPERVGPGRRRGGDSAAFNSAHGGEGSEVAVQKPGLFRLLGDCRFSRARPARV